MEVSLLLATLNRYKRAPSTEMGLSLSVHSSVPSDRLSVRLSACISSSPNGQIYVKFYGDDFYAELSRNYKFA